MKSLPYILLLLLPACTVPRALYVHIPDKTNVPCLTRRGDVRLDISGKLQTRDSSIGSKASLSVDAAYAVTDHLGIVASYRGIDNRGVRHLAYSWGYYNNNEELQRFLLNGYRFDAGAGYFQRTGEHSVVETFICLGAGNIRNSSSYDDPGYYKASFVNASASFDASIHYDAFIFSAGNRLSVFKYYELSHEGNPQFNGPDYRLTDEALVYYTPFIQLAGGFKYFLVNVQTGIEVGIANGKNHDYYYRPSPGYMTLGLSFQLNALYAQHPVAHEENH